MVNAAHSVPSAPTVTLAARLTRGVLAASLAIGSAAVSHTAAGHYLPEWTVLVLALVVSLPVCAWLCGVRLSRVQLGAAVVFSQAVLHSLFALLPATGAPVSAVPHGQGAGHSGAGAHVHVLTTAAATDASPVAQVLPDGPLIIAHVLAAVFTFAVFRRGEVILHALGALLLLSPVVMLFLRPVSLTGPRAISAHDSFSTVTLRDLWTGGGGQTLRGPPVLLS